MGQTRKLHMIGNAHIDPVWLWQWHEGFQEVKATFRSALDRMKEYDDFIFTCSSAAFYEWIELNDPGMFSEIQARVAEGRWQVVGGWWVQSDCNIPSGESFVRQGLYGQRYFREKLGVMATCGFNVDSFGHHGMLPQILKKSGLDNYVFMRPMPMEKSLSSRLFLWESDDGSQVLTFRLPYEYCTWGKELQDHVVRCADEIKAPVNELMCFYGVGNHGGGPTKANIESIHTLNGNKGLPELVMSGPDQFFTSIRQRDLSLPVYHGDLQHHASGCYAVHSTIKRLNRKAENNLALAEKFSTVAERLTSQPYPTDFSRAWKNVLFNQFHDILAGTSLKEAYGDAGTQYGEALSIADRNANYALQSLSWAIDIAQDENSRPLVVFNPHSWEVKAPQEFEYGRGVATDVLVDECDQPVPYQFVRSQAEANGRYRVCFIPEVPALGYRVYRFIADSKLPAASTEPLAITDTSLANPYYSLRFDPSTGCLVSLEDVKTGFSVIKGQAAKPWAIPDPTDTWSHGVYNFLGAGENFTLQSMRLVEKGPVKATMEVTSSYRSSRIIQRFSLYHSLPQIEVQVKVDWRESFTMLKLRFPMNLEFRKAVSEIPYGHIDRVSNGDEEPGQSWIDFSGQGKGIKQLYGLGLANDGKYSYDFDLDTMDLTVLRSPAYAHHDPRVLDGSQHHDIIDHGLQEFSYTLLPHRGNWQKSNLVQVAAQLNQSLKCIKETGHQGSLPPKGSFISIDTPNVVMTALKKAEQGGGVILRCHEIHGEETEATITLPLWNCSFCTVFGPSEIKTFRIEASPDGNGKSRMVETNLLEWTAEEML